MAERTKAKKGEPVSVRDAYGETLVELGRVRQDLVVLDADLSRSTKTQYFAREYPDRFFNIGISEADMMGTAAGLASCGKLVFASTFAIFASGRAWEQVRNTICYSNFNVKIVATHGGISVGEDGSSHQSIEDLALMRAIPNLVVIAPCDAQETRQAVLKIADYQGPVYMRLMRPEVPTIYESGPGFEIGRAITLKEGGDVTLIAAGIMVFPALQAADVLEAEGIGARVLDMHTIKPLDEEAIEKAARETKGIVTCEEHTIIGGLGGAVSEVISRTSPCAIRMVGIEDRFGESGCKDDLFREFHLTPEDIVKRAKEIV